MTSITHEYLIEQGKKWLKRKCYIVITEMAGGACEEPDVFGWGSSGSFNIECKASRSDFKADFKKRHRRYNKTLGNHRYYLTPESLIDIKELPDNWGLLELKNNKVQVVKEAIVSYENAVAGELNIAISLLRRIGQNPPDNCCIRAYTYPKGIKATVNIEEEAT